MDERADDAAHLPADELFAGHLDRLEAGEPSDFDALLAAHPDRADELRALERAWAVVVAELEGADFTPGDAEALVSGGDDGPRYDIVGELGQGGMGVVYEVFDRELERPLAMKVLRGAAPRTSARCRRFVNEARITGRLQHPGIVPVHELGTDDEGRAYFTLAKVEGLTFHDVIDRVHAPDAEWSLARAVSHLLRASEAVAFAHSRGVVHRDLKPTNVMVGPFGETYVMDWGLARDSAEAEQGDPLEGADHGETAAGEAGTADSAAAAAPADPPAPSSSVAAPPVPARAHQPPPLHPRGPAESRKVARDVRFSSSSRFEQPRTLEGEVLGTPAYMPPEQARGQLREVGPRSDVYAAGAMLYHLLTGRAPYADSGARGALELLDRVETAEPTALATLAPRAPRELRAIAERAMRRDPAERYADMGELSEDLRAWLEGRAVRAYGTGPWTVLRKWVGRNRRLAAALGAVVVAVAIGVGSNWMTRVEEEARRGRLADLQLLRGHRVELAELMGALPGDGAPLARWIDGVDGLVERLPLHRRTLEELDRLAARAGEHVDDAGRPTFADADRAFEHGRLRELVAELGAFVAPVGPLERARERLSWIGAIEERTIGAQRNGWAAAAAAVRADPRYGELELAPQVGLIPLGADVDSVLQAFLVARSGRAPARDALGRFVCADDTGCVLLLVPGGDAEIGVDLADDPHAYEGEAPRHVVRLDPYFIAKWELTAAQWQLLSHGPIGRAALESPTLPAVELTWTELMAVLPRHGLTLPTEAQWEYAARATSDGPFWWGSDVDVLFERENVRSGGTLPVDRGAPNGFGLVQVLGNVAEWCIEPYASYARPALDGTGRRTPEDGANHRTFRGAAGYNSWNDVTPDVGRRLVRISMRAHAGVDDAKDERGARIARLLDVRRVAGSTLVEPAAVRTPN